MKCDNVSCCKVKKMRGAFACSSSLMRSTEEEEEETKLGKGGAGLCSAVKGIYLVLTEISVRCEITKAGQTMGGAACQPSLTIV
ncbi:hypothetical protein T4D_5122 [Trichinella pseudospiralis]|uniref:Uncharacterized protein n=1 Tax=Trichinella pseudospiralis TaxID=6337 RepID=A0A0V1FIB6_TRIPS|nr:hypothetical protein T4D_5122 [Trichinella pseudospiralis]